MSNFVKQSTAVVVSFGPFLDKTDGVTEETGLVSALDHATTGIKLSKNGGALTIRHATVTATTYDAYGMYRVTLDTTDTGTLGTLRMAFNEAATCLPVWQDLLVLPANIYDSIIGGSDLIDVSVTQILGTAVSTPATAGILDVNVKNIDNDAASASGTVTFPNATLASTTNITAASGVALSSAGIQAIWDALTSALTTVGSIGKRIVDNLDAAITSRLASAGYTAPLDAAATRAAVGLASANLDTQLTAIDDYLDTEVAAIKAKTDNLPAAPASTTNITAASGVTLVPTTGLGNQTANITGNLSGSVGSVTAGVTLAASAVQAIWDALTSALTTVGSIGKRIVDNLDAAITSRLASAGYTAPLDAAATRAAVGLASANLDTQLTAIDDYIDTEVAAIKAKTDLIPASPSSLDAAGVRAAVGLASANLDTQLTAIDDYLDTEVAAIKAKTDNLPAAPASTTNITAASGVTLVPTTGLGNQTANITGNLSGSVGSVTAGVTLAASAVQAIWDALTSALTTVGSIGKRIVDNLDAAITSRLASAGYTAPLDAAATRAAVGLASANLDTQLTAIPTAAENAAANWDETTAAHLTAGTTGKALSDAGAGGTPLDAAGVRAAVGLASANLDTQLAAIPTAAENADATLDELLSGHAIPGSTGAALTAAEAAADWLGNDVPGSYAAGSAGYVLGHLPDRAITFVSPILTGQDLEFNHGFDYLAADGRSEDVTVSTWPTLTGATVVLKFAGLTWSVVSVTAVRTIKIAIPRARWADISLSEGSYQQPYVIQATLTNGDIVDLMTGTIRVTKV